MLQSKHKGHIGKQKMGQIRVNVVAPEELPVPNTGTITYSSNNSNVVGSNFYVGVGISIAALMVIILPIILIKRKSLNSSSDSFSVYAKRKLFPRFLILALLSFGITFTALKYISQNTGDTEATSANDNLSITSQDIDVTVVLDDEPIYLTIPDTITINDTTSRGYNLSMYGGAGDLVLEDGDDKISTITTNNTSLQDNTWGISVTEPENQESTTWQIVPSGDNNAIEISKVDDATDGDNTVTVYYGIYITPDLPYGTYTGTIIYTAKENPISSISHLRYLQDFYTLTIEERTNVISSMADSTSYNLEDNRDGQIYAIAKLKDGNVWMADNLNLGATDLTTDLTRENTNLGTTVTADTFNGWKKTTSTGTYEAGEFIPVDGIDETSNTKKGVLYNYCAASAGTICNYPSTDNSSYSFANDICPAGWRLPTGGNYGEFADLYGEYNSASLMHDAITNGGAAFAFVGRFDNGAPNTTNYPGFYWTRTRSDVANMYYMYVQSSSVIFSTNWRGSGTSVRCVARKLHTISVSYSDGIEGITINGASLMNGDTIKLEEGISYEISATPSLSYGGFEGWSATSGEISAPNEYVTNYTVGSSDAIISASMKALTALQNWNDCDNIAIGGIVQLYDNRDAHIYSVQRLADGKCWMMENLDLGRTSITTDLTSANTNLATTVTAETFNSWKKTTGSGTYNAGEYISVSGTDSTSGTAYGTLYNYYAASAGTISGSSNSNNASYDICPAGWRLPTGGSSGEFQALYNQYNSNALMRAPITENGAAFALAGYFGSAAPAYQGSLGHYWSSTRYGDAYMYDLHLYTSYVSPAYYGYRSYGYAIRCVLKKTTHTLTVSYGTGVSSVTVNGQTIADGGTINLEEGVAYSIETTLAAGYLFDSWSATSGTIGSVTTQSTTYTISTSNATLTATADLPLIQNLSSSNCTSVASQVKDSRDEHIYTIKRLNDGNCWMMENLDLGRTAITTDLTSSNTNLATTVTASTFNSWKKTTGSGTYDAGEFISVSGTDSTSGTAYGTLYNYYAASAGTISGSSNSNNASYDICPAGWRLPTGGSSGEFQALYAEYNSNALMRASIENNGAAFALAGYFRNSTPASQGSIGRYWSSTMGTLAYMYDLNLYTSYVDSAGSYNRDGGSAIRCVLK